MLCAGEMKKDIADLITSVPAVGDVFNIVDKIGAGNSHDMFMFFLTYLIFNCDHPFDVAMLRR